MDTKHRSRKPKPKPKPKGLARRTATALRTCKELDAKLEPGLLLYLFGLVTYDLQVGTKTKATHKELAYLATKRVITESDRVKWSETWSDAKKFIESQLKRVTATQKLDGVAICTLPAYVSLYQQWRFLWQELETNYNAWKAKRISAHCRKISSRTVCTHQDAICAWEPGFFGGKCRSS